MKKISAREVAREFSRVRHDVERGEEYEVTHRGRTVMRILPPERKKGTLGALVAALQELPPDPTLADDIQAVRDFIIDTPLRDPWEDD